jgi:hypothetical protein
MKSKVPLKRRKRGTGGIQIRDYGGWDATYHDRGHRYSKRFRSYEEAEQFLRAVNPVWRDIWLNELRGLLWAELMERIEFRGYGTAKRRKIA